MLMQCHSCEWHCFFCHFGFGCLSFFCQYFLIDIPIHYFCYLHLQPVPTIHLQHASDSH